MKWIGRLITHGIALFIGVALGIFLLPILTAGEPPSATELSAVQTNAAYVAEFDRNRSGSDLLHWGEGMLYFSPDTVAYSGKLAPGPDYRLYLSPVFVENEQQFLDHKDQMIAIGDVNSFNGFMLPLPDHLDVSRYTTAVVWCESFNEFISSGRYQ